MSCQWTRRALLALLSASALFLGACGSGSIESQLEPSRIVVFGDGMSDLGQGGSRYTVNDGAAINVWTQDMAARFGTALTTAASGGTSYATGNARIIAEPDAAGSTATPTVKEQIDTFLAGSAAGPSDLLVVSAGTSDVIAEVAKVTAGTQTPAQMIGNVRQAGRDMAAQVRRLVLGGATHVVVMGPYHLGKSPWALTTSQVDLLTDAASKFNEELLVAIVDLGATVLYIDAPLLLNLMVANPSGYELLNVTDPVCISVDPGPGIGIGAGQINSALCTPSTLLAGANHNAYMFADRVYLAPQAHRKLGEYAHSRVRERW